MVTLALLHTLAFSAGTADFGASHVCLVLSVLVHGSCGWYTLCAVVGLPGM
jgi:hypothetical protein